MPRPKSLNKAGKRALIIVDGLDEMAKTGERNPLLDLILDNADSLPDYLAILLSSRHEGDLRYRMAGVEAIEIVAESLENQNDLCLWLNQHIPDHLPDHQRLSIVDKILHHSDGVFLYLRLLGHDLSDYIEKPELSPAGLDGFFTASFKRYFPDIENYSSQQRPFLELLISALEPVSQTSVCSVLGWDRYRCDQVIASFGALFHERAVDWMPRDLSRQGLMLDDESRPTQKLLPFHKALFDWLTDRTRSGLYRVSREQGLRRWADGLWHQYQNPLAGFTEYGLRYLPQHLALVDRHDDVSHCLLNLEFILQRIEQPGIVRDLYPLIEVYRLAFIKTPAAEALSNWAFFFRANAHYLNKSHPHWPAKSILLQRASEQSLESPIRKAVDAYLQQHPNGYWLRSLTPSSEAFCRVLDDDYWGAEALIAVNRRVVGLTKTGEVRVYDTVTGRRELTLIADAEYRLILDDAHLLTWANQPRPLFCLWDLNSGECLLSIEGRGEIVGVCALDDGYFAVSFESRYLGIWERHGQLKWAVDDLTHVIGHIWPLTNGYFLTDTQTPWNGDAENVLSLWQLNSTQPIAVLRTFNAFDNLVIEQTPTGEILTHSSLQPGFQIWDSQTGALLASSNNQPHQSLQVLSGNSLRIMTAHRPAIDDHITLMRIRTWHWNGQSLEIESAVDLIPDTDQDDRDFFDQSASLTDGQLLADGLVLLPSPMSLWSGLTGEKRADLKGSWSMLWDILDFEGFYRRFNDGRLLTWSEEAWTVSGLATAFYLWDKQGVLIREVIIDSRFRDIRILNDDCFVTFNCDDSIEIWDGKDGELLQTCSGFAAKVDNVQHLASGQWLITDHARTLSLWQPTFNAEQPLQASHASRQEAIQVALFKDRILSYSLDSFPPRLWDVNTGQLVAVLPAHDHALGARLEGIIPLSDERFLTWGHEPALHIYDSQSGDCLATLRDTHNHRVGHCKIWPLADDQILGLLWDNRLCVFDLVTNTFSEIQVIAENVLGAYPVTDDYIVFWTQQNELRLWNRIDYRVEFEYLTPDSPIKQVFNLSGHRLGILSENPQVIDVLDWRSGNLFSIQRATNKPVSSLLALSDQRLVVCCRNSAEVWMINASPSLQFEWGFDGSDQLKFMTECPNGHLLTQVSNHRATLWSVWHRETGELIGSTMMPSPGDDCLAAYTVHQTVLLHLVHAKTQSHFFKALDWHDPVHIQWLSLNELHNYSDLLAINKLNRKLGLSKGDWTFWGSSGGMPIAMTKLGEASIHCEWYGEPMRHLLALTDDGRLVGFGRQPIILQLYKDHKPVGFLG
jgi:WD40 repeat protein